MQEREIEPRYTAEVNHKGFRILLILPFDTAPALAGTMNKLIESGFTIEPEVVYDSSKLPTPEKKEIEPKPGFFTIHGIEMRKFEKNGKSWYSHKTETGWCRGKAK